MTKFLNASFLSLVFLFAQASLAATPQSDLYVVKFHADWCGSCMVLGPVIDKARGKAGLDDTGALFVTLDLTDSTTRHQAGLMANAIGLGEYFASNAGKTGFALLVDPKTGKVKGKLTKDMDANAIIKAIESQI